MPAPTMSSSGGVGVLSNTTNTSHNIMSPQHQQQQSRPPLRRATYVHVSDLTSAYNIDHGRLEKELQRVKQDRLDSQMNPKSHPENPSVLDDEGMNPPTSQKDSSSGDLVEPSISPSQSQNNTASNKRLQPPRGGYNLCLLVGSVEVVVDKLRVDGSRVRLAEVEVGDETGTVSLRARDDQIDLLSEISERKGAVVLRNSTLELYQGKHIRLAVTKWGKLTPYPDQVASTPAPPSRRNTDRYFSLIDLSAVASEMAVFSTSPAMDSYTTNSMTSHSHSNSNNNNNARSNDLDSAGSGMAGANFRGNSHSNNNNNNTGGNRNSRRGGGAGGQNRGKSSHGGMGISGMNQSQHAGQHPSAPYPLMRGGYTGAGTLHNYGYAPPPPQLGDHTTGWWQPRGRAGGPPHHGHHHHDPATAQLLMQQHYELASQRAQLAAAQQQQLHYQSLSSAAGQTPGFDAFGAPADLSGRTPAFPPPPSGVYSSPPLGSLPDPAANAGATSPHHSPRMNPQAPTFDPVFRRNEGHGPSNDAPHS